ncbi:hypothetical protein SDC9_103475 [bioreactor metagenome]|uniref:Uncharacterized protein n=1 Tax=bioreactor metagenome TaxID=1076179 RepID=A0A645AUY2_9ZZZZ
MYRRAVMAYMEAGFQHQRDRILAHSGGAISRDIGDGDAFLFRVGDIDYVVARRQHINEFYARAGVDNIFRDRHLFRINQFGVANAVYHLLLVRLRRAVIHGQVSQSA